MDRNERNILILGILVLVLLAVGYYFLLLGPLRTQNAQAYEERTRKEDQERQLEQTVAQLENIRREAPDIERQILEYSKRLPTEDEIPTLIIQIQEVAVDEGVTQLSIEPGAPEPPPGGGDFSRIPFTMSFEGDYSQMQNFIRGVRNLARLVTINELTYCRFPQREGAECPIEQPGEGRGETTGGETTGGNRERDEEIEGLLTVEISAETYVQPAAGGETTGAEGAASPTPPPPPAGKDKAGGNKAGGAKAGGKAGDGGKSK